MIEVTKINGVKVLINPDLIELVEETPDTVVSFTTGRKIIIKESRQDIKELVKSYRKDIFAQKQPYFLGKGVLWLVFVRKCLTQN